MSEDDVETGGDVGPAADAPQKVTGAFGPDGRIKYVSASVRDVLGHAPGDLAGRSISYLFGAKDMARIDAARDRLCEGDNCDPLPVKPRRKRRFRKTMNAHLTAMFDTTSGAPHLFHFTLWEGEGG